MRLTLLITILLILNSSIFAQILTGVVSDEFQKPIEEVTILNKKNGQHYHSNKQGKFFIEKISLGDTLEFSHVSYTSKLIIINKMNQYLDVVLSVNAVSLEQVIISPKENAIQLITDIDLQTNPVNSSQEILETVPGLFIGQHAGGGKAEQIFLRGFDIDHGTDINISVDGMPVNMVSHAHGQGYSDLHFVIPETIENIDFGKGPYFENKGNFNTAGYVDFITKRSLEKSIIKLETGQFYTSRFLGMFDLLESNTQDAYVATEFLVSDGPFESSQSFNRINLFGKYTASISNSDRISITSSYFSSKWDASGQIPERAVASGLISRFGAIDDTEGGSTSRANILMNYDKVIDRNTTLNTTIFLSQYEFDLYSNFTFFLDDSINGDQIRQTENRMLYGVNSEYQKSFSTNKLEGDWLVGISIRNDQSKGTELSHTLNRTEIIDRIQFGDINETNMGAYLATNIHFKKWTFNPSIRFDHFDFQYNDKLQSVYESQKQYKAIISPKFNITYNQSPKVQFYLKTGKGFHSNDTRVVVAKEDENILPSAYASDIGLVWKPIPKMLFNLAYWHLYLEQELVYVGDAGIVEPSGKTHRKGIDFSYRYQPFSWFFYKLDANYTHARAIEEPTGSDYIPLASNFTLVNGINIIHKSGWNGGVHIRHLADRPANEDNSIVAKGYTITDLNIGYQWKKMNLGIQIQNLFNTEWNETQFATESRLKDEVSSVEEIHFTPGTPFFIKAMVEYKF